MRVNVKNKLFHLSYCSNLYISNNLNDLFYNLQNYYYLKKKMCFFGELSIGLWISSDLSKKLLNKNNIILLKNWLHLFGLYIVTFNGFPYGKFHKFYIKDVVYLPGWLYYERKDYIIRLVYILSILMPINIEGTISTSPISYKFVINNANSIFFTYNNAVKNFIDILLYILDIFNNSGKYISISIEPEPGCFIETSNDVICFYNNWLLKIGSILLSKKVDISKEICEYFIIKHIKICYDTCHFYVYYESFLDVFNKFKKCGIDIGKIQLSSCLKINFLNNLNIDNLFKSFLFLKKSFYLHQSVVHLFDNRYIYFKDFFFFLDNFFYNIKKIKELRIHYHFPIFLKKFLVFSLISDDIKIIFDILNKTDHNIQHLEIETYTINNLNSYFKVSILDIISKEYNYVLKILKGKFNE